MCEIFGRDYRHILAICKLGWELGPTEGPIGKKIIISHHQEYAHCAMSIYINVHICHIYTVLYTGNTLRLY